jgi:hypothetical protein
MQTWLQTHVIAGLLGAYLALLHSGFRFHGLAGVLLAVTMVIVVSGFIGRYIYTAVPRTVDGLTLGPADFHAREAETDARLRELGIDWVNQPGLAAACTLPPAGWGLVLGRFFWRWRCGQRLRRALAALLPGQPGRAYQVRRLLLQRFIWELQLQSLAAARQLLAWWHLLHVPLGIVQLTLLVLHILGAVWFLG